MNPRSFAAAHAAPVSPVSPAVARAAPPLASAPAREASPAARLVSVCGDCIESADAWARALAHEGLAVATRLLDDSVPAPADALVLHVDAPLPERLARLRSLRAQCAGMPLVVVARALRDLDQVLAFEMGADEVIDTGTSSPVVAARLRALWRRDRRDADEGARELRYGALRLSRLERAVHLDDARVPLTEGEFEVLWLLASHAGLALSRREILRRVRGLDDHPTDRSIDSRVYRIRAKLGDHEVPVPRIRTVRNHGYAFSPVGW